MNKCKKKRWDDGDLSLIKKEHFVSGHYIEKSYLLSINSELSHLSYSIVPVLFVRLIKKKRLELEVNINKNTNEGRLLLWCK